MQRAQQRAVRRGRGRLGAASVAAGCVLAGLAVGGGCARRSITVTSSPAGAMVWLNDVQVGRTPVEADFRWYGIYDVRLRLDGFEPLSTSKNTGQPWYELPGPDLVAGLVGARTRVRWHFDLEPTAEALDRLTAEQDLLARARGLAAESAALGERELGSAGSSPRPEGPEPAGLDPAGSAPAGPVPAGPEPADSPSAKPGAGQGPASARGTAEP
ncbi:MAG: hypothetical protein C0513_01350 [Isosphaera sp.]|nr:hypothetical protein [Isosphaera sp.]